MSQTARARITVLAASTTALALGVAFVWLHLTTPSDGARLEPGQSVWTRDGVMVTPLHTQPGGLRQGDVVIAVGGRSTEAWAQALFQSGVARPEWRFGQTTTYTVVRDGHVLDVPVRLGPYPLGGILSDDWGALLYGLIFELVASFVFLRRPRDRAAMLLFLGASSLLGSLTWAFGLQVSDLVGGPGFWLFIATTLLAYGLCWIAFLHFALIFPKPHPLVARRRWIIPSMYIVPATCGLMYIAGARSLASNTLAWLGLWPPLEGVLSSVYVALIVVVVVSTYRTSRDAATRQKIRLVVFAGLISTVGGLALWLIPTDVLGRPIISVNALGLLALPVPVALAIAILRFQLFDIDVLIRRTLVYGTLTAILGAIYFAVVLGAQAVVRAVTGQPGQQPVFIVASTLLVAALFNPSRRRLQALIDRRFYRRKYDAARTLADFGATLRTETDLGQLSAQLVAVVQETMQPTYASLWLRPLEPPAERRNLPVGSSAVRTSASAVGP